MSVGLNELDAAALGADVVDFSDIQEEVDYGPQRGDENLRVFFRDRAIANKSRGKATKIIEFLACHVSWTNAVGDEVSVTHSIDDSVKEYWTRRFPRQWESYVNKSEKPKEKALPLANLNLTEYERVLLADVNSVHSVQALARLSREEIAKLKLPQAESLVKRAKEYLKLMETH